jgi:hypothetical protein
VPQGGGPRPNENVPGLWEWILHTICQLKSHFIHAFNYTNTFIQPNKPSLEGIIASSWITKTQKKQIQEYRCVPRVWSSPFSSSRGLVYFDGSGSNLFQTGAAPNFPGFWGLYPGFVGMYGPEASDSVGGLDGWSKCPEAWLSRVVFSGAGPQSWQPERKNANFGLSSSRPMHQKCCRHDEGNKVTESIFTGSREVITPADSGEIISQSPNPWSVSGAGLINLQSLPLIPPY